MSKELFINLMRSRRIEPTERDVDNFVFAAESLLSDKIEALEAMVDNAHEALEAVKASGACPDDVLEMIDLGLSNKPQLKTTRLG